MRLFIVLCAIIISLSACSFFVSSDIHLVDVKTATAVDEKLMPVKITDVFPKDSSKVICWFQWNDAKVNTQVTAKWHYVTDDVHILDYPFHIPKKTGMGSVALSAPEGRPLPSGDYKVQLFEGKHLLRSAGFKIE